MPSVSMTVNGKAVTADVDPRTLLVQFLREHLRLTGSTPLPHGQRLPPEAELAEKFGVNRGTLREALRESGLDSPGDERVMLVRTACQHPCNLAPLVSVQPDNVWYGELNETRVREIVQSHFVEGNVCEAHAYRAGERVRTPDLAVDMKDHYPVVNAAQGGIRIHDALARPAMKVVDAGALFMRIENRGGGADKLIAVETPFSDRPRIHDPALSHKQVEDIEFEPLALPATTTMTTTATTTTASTATTIVRASTKRAMSST